jgi:hypothetical protein
MKRSGLLKHTLVVRLGGIMNKITNVVGTRHIARDEGKWANCKSLLLFEGETMKFICGNLVGDNFIKGAVTNLQQT